METNETARFLPSVRLCASLTLHLAMLITMLTRFCISTALLCMVRDNRTHSGQDNVTLLQESVGDGNNSSEELQPTLAAQGEFDWDKPYQGWIVASYFYAFVLFLVPGGWLVDRFGAHHMLRAGMATAGVTCLILPPLTRLHSALLILCRAILGASSCLVIPSIPALSRQWSLPGEYTTVFAIAWSGFYTGTAANFPLGTTMCQTNLGWPAIFYVAGVIGVLWLVLSALFIQNDPLTNQLIRGPEKTNFEEARKVAGATTGKVASVPFLKIFTNFQVWNVAIAFFIGLWNLYSSTIAMPQFMKNFMKFDLSKNGTLSALPSLLLAVTSVLAGRIFSYLHVNRGWSKTNCRKLFNFISNFFPAGLLLATLLLPFQYRSAAVVCLVLAVGLTGGVFTAGPFSGSADIGPQYTATIFSIAACTGNIPGFVIPPVIAAMTPNDTRQEWISFLSISVAAHLFSSVYISLFWKSEVQPFAREEKPPADGGTELADSPSHSESPH